MEDKKAIQCTMELGSCNPSTKIEPTESGDLSIVAVTSPEFIQARAPGSVLRSICNTVPVGGDAEISYNQVLMPVNIKQISDALENRYNNLLVINNTASPSVKIIGMVTGKTADEFKGSFRIDDGTGKMNASIWFTGDRSELDCIQEGAYAMVVGRVKMDGPAVELSCFVCRPIVNFNDIPHHHLSVIATHIDLVIKPEKTVHSRVAELWTEAKAKEWARSHGKKESTMANKMCIATSSIAQHEGPEGINKGGFQVGEVTIPKDHITPSAPDSIMSILRLESKRAGPAGVHVDIICSKMGLDRASIRSDMEDLALAGELYTTIDGDHYAST